ncbi:esiB [Symbiodinium natans]|uniref:EsiB protein n=1 Tax=Symbiodinium natans TaxID=878477 RepID=A0A812SM69_9DINO|nr:esiB [Symbiodinium natans]
MQCVEVTQDLIVAGDSSGLMRMWSRESGEVVRDIQVAKEHKYVKALVISGDSVFTGDYCNLVQQWSLSTGQREAVFTGNKAGIVSLAVSGDYIISGGGDGAVLLFDRRTAKAADESSEVTAEPVALLYKASGFVCSLAITDDRLLLPDRDQDKAVSIRFLTHTGELVPENIRDKRSYKCGMQVWQAVAAAGCVYALCRDFTVKKFAAGSRQLLQTINVKAVAQEAKNPYTLKVSQDRIYVSYISSGEIGVFSTEGGRRQMEKAFKGHQGAPETAQLRSGQKVFQVVCISVSSYTSMDISLLERAAAVGSTEAQYALGAALLTGSDGEKDLPRAASLFRAAALQGQAAAQCNLGAMCAQGLGVPQDTAEAKIWYEKSAAQGNPDAQFNLAMVLLTGPAADLSRARCLASEAAAGGHPKAGALLEKLGALPEEVKDSFKTQGTPADPTAKRLTAALLETRTLLQGLALGEPRAEAFVQDLLCQLEELQDDLQRFKDGQEQPAKSRFRDAEIVD